MVSTSEMKNNVVDVKCIIIMIAHSAQKWGYFQKTEPHPLTPHFERDLKKVKCMYVPYSF